jgi:hypothetical protein
VQQVEVRFVEESALPADQAWVIGVTHRGERFLFVKEGAWVPAIIEQAWQAGFCLNTRALQVAV